MKRIFLALIGLCACAMAYATNDRVIEVGPPLVVVHQPEHKIHAPSTSTSNSSATNRNRNSASQTQAAKGGRGGSATGGAANAVSTSGDALGGDASNNGVQSFSYSAHRSAASAMAPSLNPTVSCAGVSAGAVQGTTFGLSLGGSRIDEECQRQELAKTAYAMGDRTTAEEILCDSAVYRQARQRSGRPCAQVVVTAEEAKTYSGTDPYVRARLGLPELRP